MQLDNEAEHEAEQPGHRPYARGASRPLTAFIVEMRRDAISIVEMRGTEGPSHGTVCKRVPPSLPLGANDRKTPVCVVYARSFPRPGTVSRCRKVCLRVRACACAGVCACVSVCVCAW